MIAPRRRTPPRSLAEADPGDTVQVRIVLFEFVRSRCWDLSIRAGEVLHCVGSEGGGVTVAREDGTRVVVPEECARFIGVRSVESSAVGASWWDDLSASTSAGS